MLTEFVWPALKILSLLFSNGYPTEVHTWRSIVFLGTNHIGDILYRTSQLPTLKERIPNCKLYFIVPENCASLLKANPCIDEVIVIDLEKSKGKLTALWKLRSCHFDSVICYDTGAYWRYHLYALLIGAPNRVGYTHRGFSALMTMATPIKFPQPFPAYFRDMVNYITGESKVKSIRPVVHLSDEDKFIAEKEFTKIKGNYDGTIALFLTSRQQKGVFPAEKLALTARKVADALKFRLVLMGTKNDEPSLRKTCMNLKLNGVVLAGVLPLPSVIAFLGKCHLVITTDSGPRHMANAAGTPVAFFRNTNFFHKEAGVYYAENELDLAGSEEFPTPDEEIEFYNSVNTSTTASRIITFLKDRNRKLNKRQ